MHHSCNSAYTGPWSLRKPWLIFCFHLDFGFDFAFDFDFDFGFNFDFDFDFGFDFESQFDFDFDFGLKSASREFFSCKSSFLNFQICLEEELSINMDVSVKLARMELVNALIKIQSVTHGILVVKLLEE